MYIFRSLFSGAGFHNGMSKYVISTNQNAEQPIWTIVSKCEGKDECTRQVKAQTCYFKIRWSFTWEECVTKMVSQQYQCAKTNECDVCLLHDDKGIFEIKGNYIQTQK